MAHLGLLPNLGEQPSAVDFRRGRLQAVRDRDCQDSPTL